jgi:hypothetical protein
MYFHPMPADPVLFGIAITRMGSTAGTVYAVGTEGFIAKWDGSSWVRLASGTVTTITDIFGSEDVTLATVTDEYGVGDRRLLRIASNGLIDTLEWSPGSRLQSVWFATLENIMVGGGKCVAGKPGSWRLVVDLPGYYNQRIRGNANNDVFVVGAFGLFGHYNGQTWRTYVEHQQSNATLYSVSSRLHLVMAVGQMGNQGVIILGKRL